MFLPYLKSNDDLALTLLATSFYSMDNITCKGCFVYIDIVSQEEVDFIHTGSSDSTIEMQGDIGIYVDENGVIKVIEGNDSTLLVVKYDEKIE
jgi:hypothetical protein